MTNHVVIALSRSGTTAIKKSASLLILRSSLRTKFNETNKLYLHQMRTIQSLSNISLLPTTLSDNSLLPTKNKINFGSNSVITTFSSSLLIHNRFFGSDSSNCSGSPSSPKGSRSLKMLRGDLVTLSRKSGSNAVPDKAADILQQMIQLYSDEVNVSDCNKVISVWTKTRSQDGPSRALGLLNQMMELYKENGNESVRPSVETFNFVIDAFAQRGDIKNSSLVFNMQVNDVQVKNNVKAKPNRKTFSNMIYACSKSRSENAPTIAKELLTTMINWHEKGELKDRPNEVLYITAMNVCARNGDITRATSILQLMENNMKNVSYLKAYSILINAWSKSRKDDAPRQAERILNKLSNMFVSGTIEEGPNVITFSSVIDTYAKHGDIEGACNILEKMENDFKAGNNKAKPNMRTYSTLINAWSKSSDEDAPHQARNLLNKMIRLQSNGDLDEAPDTITYCSVMDTHARHGDIEGACNILEMMENDFNSGNKNAKPDMRTYNILINAWSKSSDVDAPQQARNVLNNMISLHSNGVLDKAPTTITYCSVMDAYAVQGDVEGASEILQMMEDDFKSGNNDVRPDMRTYSTLINAWAKSGNSNSPIEAEKILRKMIDWHSEGELKQGPTIIAYNSVMDAYANKGEVEGANRVLEMMRSDSKNVRPDMISYSTLIKAWDKSNKEEAQEEVESILQKMNDLHESGYLRDRADVPTYKSMIECLQKIKGTEDRVYELQALMKTIG